MHSITPGRSSPCLTVLCLSFNIFLHTHFYQDTEHRSQKRTKRTDQEWQNGCPVTGFRGCTSRFCTVRFLFLRFLFPGEQPLDRQYVKLNTNESPFPPSPKVLEALTGAEINKLNLYSDPTCSVLVNAIAENYGVNAENVIAERYIEAYHEHPFATDWRYFWGTVGNILFKHKRSH